MAVRVSERLDTIRRISSELAKRYEYDEIKYFAEAFGLQGNVSNWEDQEDFARQLVSRAEISVLSEMVEDLGLEASLPFSIARQMPALWEGSTLMRVFISHLSSEKEKATRLRDVMQPHGLSAFVAHEDIEPTLEWQVQIERALSNMELFVSMHTEGFLKVCGRSKR